jgi:hypothetical protein
MGPGEDIMGNNRETLLYCGYFWRSFNQSYYFSVGYLHFLKNKIQV